MTNRDRQQTIRAQYTRFLGLGFTGAVFCISLLLPQSAEAIPSGFIYDNVSEGWTSYAFMPSGRTSSGYAMLSNSLYVVAGNGASGFPTNSVFRYDGGVNWTTCAALPRSPLNPAVFALGGYLYCAGGYSNGWATAGTYRYNGSSWTAAASLPSARRDFASAVMGGHGYVIGGADGGANLMNTVLRFDGTNWTSVAALPANRGSAMAATLGNTLYVMGGTLDAGVQTTSVLKFDGTSWTSAGNMPRFQYHASICVESNAIVVIGGLNTSYNAITNIIAFDGTTWTERPGLSSPLADAAAGVISNRLYVAGGGSYSSASAETRYYRTGSTGVAPTAGEKAGGFTVTITGTGLGNGSDITNVTLCGVAASSIGLQSATQVVITAGAAASGGTGDVRVYSASRGMTVKSNYFTYNSGVLGLYYYDGTDYFYIASPSAPSSSLHTDFGEVPMGRTYTNELVVAEDSYILPINISSVAVTGTGAAAFEISGVPTSLVAGDYTNFFVRFTPPSVGVYTAAVSFVNDGSINPYIMYVSGTATGAVVNTPVITIQPISTGMTVGGAASLSVSTSGTGPFGYQWYKDGVRQTGQTNSTLSFSSFKFTDSGSYSVVITNAAGMTISLPASLSVSNAALLAWGYNMFGGLGNGTTTPTNRPFVVASNAVAMTGGGYHSLFVKADGTLLAMGRNNAGQLGNGTTGGSANLPITVASNVVAVAAGETHSLFVKADGTLWAMGFNGYGQLGNGNYTDANLPIQVASNVVAVAGGGWHSLFVKTDGTLWAMGLNNYGQLGNGMNGPSESSNRPILVTNNVVAIAAGNQHSLFVKTDGTLWAMGYNWYGQLGNGANGSGADANRPIQVTNNVAAMTAGKYHSLFVKTDGTLWAMGNNSHGELGNGTSVNTNQPIQVANNVVVAAGGNQHSLFVKADGTLWAMGDNAFGQLGDGTSIGSYVPVLVNGGGLQAASLAKQSLAYHSLAIAEIAPPTVPAITTQPVSAVVTVGGAASLSVSNSGTGPFGYQWLKDGVILSGKTNSTLSFGSFKFTDSGSYSVVITNTQGMAISIPASLSVPNAKLLAWGNNGNGQLGSGTTVSTNRPITIASNVVAIASGCWHSLLVKADGTLWATGYNGNGQLGIGMDGETNLPVQVTNNVVAVAAGRRHSLFVKTDGTLWAMGYNSNGQLGNGTTGVNAIRPVAVTSNVVAVAAGEVHSLFVKADGTLWAMGFNSTGQLGNGTTGDTNRPVQVANNVVTVAAGFRHSLFVKTDGTLWGMGQNFDGQLGNGMTVSTNSPVQVASQVVAMAAGNQHSLFEKADGTLWAMGANYAGQLGVNTCLTTNQPMLVANNVLAVASGSWHSLFVKANGTLWATGANGDGQLGDGTKTLSTVPVLVNGGSLLAVALAKGSEASHSLAIAEIMPPTAPAITTQPVSAVVTLGQLASLSVTHSGIGPFGYQWRKDGAILSGQTNSTLSYASFAFTNSGSYSVVITNPQGMTISIPASLSVPNAPLLAWGYNDFGQLGNGSLSAAYLPITVASNVVASSPGSTHSLFVKADGTLWAMGQNNYGQLGNGITNNSTLPVYVTNNVAAVAAGNRSSLFVKTDGTLWGMGCNDKGQLGNSTTNNSKLPVYVTSNVVAVAAGDTHSKFIKADGTLWGMGNNGNGQLGIGTVDYGIHSTPVCMASNVVAIAEGIYHGLFIKADGTLWSLGRNMYGQLGDGTTTERSLPVFVTNNVVSVSGGGFHSVFAKTDHSIWTVGYNLMGQLGNGTTASTNQPVYVTNNVVAIVARIYHSFFVKEDGVLWAMGSNSYGALGDGTGMGQSLPVVVNKGFLRTASLATGGSSGSHSLAVAEILTPGLQVLGINGAAIASGSAAIVATGAKFAPVLPGATVTHTLSITNNGTALMTISGAGVQGSGFSVAGIPTTIPVGAVSSFDVVFNPGAVGSFTSTLSLSNNSPTSIYTVNLAGSCYQLSVNCGPYAGGNSITITNGNFGSITNVLVGGVQATITGSGTTWVTITLPATGSEGVKDIVVQTSDNGAITLTGAYTVNPAGVIWDKKLFPGGPYLAAGAYHSLGVQADGSVVAWGANDAGQATVPAPNSNFVGVAAGNVHSLGVQADGSVVAWGANNIYVDYGQTNVPAPNADFVAVAAGTRHSLGLKSNGMIMAWGDNAMGQATVPAPNTNFVAVAAGGFHSLGLKSDGTLTAWGENSDNQTAVPAPNSDFVAAAAGFAHSLGLKTDGTIVAWGRNNNSQATVPAPNTNFVAVAAGYNHSLGLKSDGTIVAWGRNNYGQTNVPSPNANFVAVAAGYYHSLGLKADGMIVVWGDNSNGQTNVPAPNTDFGMGPAILPSSGSYTGNYQVVISGTNLCNGTLGDVTSVTLCGVAATVTAVNGSTQIVVTAGVSGVTGLGDVRVFSTSYGETMKSNAFEYLRAAQAPLVFSPTTPQTYGTTNTLTVSGGSGTGAVSYVVLSGPGQIVGGTNLVVTGGVGTIQVQALKAQDSLYFVTAITSGVTVVKADQTITFPTIGDQLTTNSVVLEAVASSGLAPAFSVLSGSASISDGTTLTFTGAGSVSIVATQAGDGNWNSATSVTNTFTVSMVEQAALTFSFASTQIYATTNTISATGGSGTGLVSYALQSGPGTILGAGPLSKFIMLGVTGVKLVVNSGTGTVVVVATKAADARYNAQSVTGLVTCIKAEQSITFNGFSDQFWTNRLVLAATASSGLGVHFSVVSGPAVISGGTNLSFTGYGNVGIVAAQTGDDNYSKALYVTNFIPVIGPQFVVLGTNGVVVASSNVTSVADGTDFGTRIIGMGAQTNTFRIVNSGNAELTISGVETNGPNPSSFRLLPFVAVVPESSEVSYQVVFTPQCGPQNASFTFTFNGTNSPYVVNLAGIGLGGGIALSTNALAYTGIFGGSNLVSQTVGMTNVGVSSFTYTNVIVYSAGASDWLTSLPAAGTVALGDVCVLTNAVNIAGVNAGTYVATNFVMAADATNSPQCVVVTLTVAKADQTITFPNPGDQLTTNSVVLAATASSGFVPAFSVASGSALISEGTNLTFTGAGSVSIVAEQVGDANWNPAASVTNTFTVSRTEQAVLTFNPASPQTYATTNSITATGGSGTGRVSYAVYSGPGTIVGTEPLFRPMGMFMPPSGAKLVVNSGTGTVVVVATKAASALYNAQSVTGIVVCAKAPASVELSNTTQVYSGAARVVTATTVPAGQTVDLTYDGSVNAPTNTGVYNVIGIVNEVNYQGGATGTLTVTQASQTINFLNLGQQEVTNKVVLSATAGTAMTVSFSVASGPAVISNAVNLSFSSAGRVTILATQSGDSNWTAAPTLTNTFDVIGVITNVTPTTGTVYGGTQVTIAGLWLGNGADITHVTLCNIPATIVTQSIHSVTVTTGVSPVVTHADVVVQSAGFGTVALTNGFTYQPVPPPPVALSAIDVTTNGFTARWTSSEGATNYLIDVSETNTFTSYAGIYNNRNVGDVTACLVTGLTDGTTYYYRLRAANSYGASTNSNTIEVPVSDNTPYIQYERTNGVASAGSSDVIDMTKLFHGSGKSYSVVANSNPGLVATSFSGSDLILDYAPGGSGSASITVRVTDLSTGFWVETTITVAVGSAPTLASSPIVLNRQNGLFEQSVTVSNTSALIAKAVTLTVKNLSVGATLNNATGVDEHGNAEIQWVGTFAPNSSMVFTLQYYTKNRSVVPTSTIEVSLSLEDPETLITGTKFSINGEPITLGKTQSFLIEFSAVPGRTYYIQYKALFTDPWKTVQPPIVAPVNRIQWIDSGPPSTESAPGSVPSRLYQVIEALR